MSSFDTATTELMRSPQPESILLEGFGDVVPFSDYPSNDWPGGRVSGGLVPYSEIYDRQDGRFRPVFENEIDLAYIRGASRRVMALSSVLNGAITALQVYTLGNGPSVSVVGKQKNQPLDDQGKLLARVVDRVQEQLCLPELLEELHDRSHQEGESLAVLHKSDEDTICPEIIEMDCLRQPQPSPEYLDWIESEFGINCYAFDASWSFGILTQRRLPSRPLGYHVLYDQSGDDYEFYPETRTVHIKRNVPWNVKRGVSTFYQSFDDLRSESKLSGNMGKGAALQAAIAWVEEFAPGTTSSQGGASSPVDFTKTIPTNIGTGGGNRQVKSTHYAPGTIIRTSAGKKYTPGPMGSERNGNFEIAAQYLLRRIGVRVNMPEYMISGDASNANYASTMVAESPFVKARQKDQEFMIRAAKQILWKSVMLVWRGMTGQPLEVLENVKRAYDIKVTLPAVQNRDPLKLAEQLSIEKANGWVSDETAITELGRDPEEERALGAEPAQQQTQESQGSIPGLIHGVFGDMHDGLGESWDELQDSPDDISESWDESQHPRDDRGQFVTKIVLLAARKNPKIAAQLKAEVTRPAERAKLDDILNGKHDKTLLQHAGKLALKTISGIWNAPKNIAHFIDNSGQASVKHAARVENFIHGRGGYRTTWESTAQAALQGALESVETTDEARQIIESLASEGYP